MVGRLQLMTAWSSAGASGSAMSGGRCGAHLAGDHRHGCTSTPAACGSGKGALVLLADLCLQHHELGPFISGELIGLAQSAQFPVRRHRHA